MAENRGFGKGSRNEGYKPAARGGKPKDARGSSAGYGAGKGTGYGAARDGKPADSRGAGYGAPRGGSSSDTRSAGYGAAREGRPTDTRSAGYGASRGSDTGAFGGKRDGAAGYQGGKGRSSSDFRGGRTNDAPAENRTTDFRGGRLKDAPNDSRPNDFRGERPKYTPGDGRPTDNRGERPKYTPGSGRPTDFSGNRNRKPDAGGYKGSPRTEKPQGYSSTTFQGDGRETENKRNDRPYRQNEAPSKREELQDKRNFAAEDQMEEYQGDLDKLEGRNSVLEALKAGRSINKIFVAKGDREGSVNQIVAIAREKHILIQEIERVKLDAMSVTHSHQGVIALTAAKDYVEVEEILASATASGRPPFIIILDEITDSHNLGSMLRTANAAGVHGIIIPKRRAIGLTSIVSKASAGAIEYVPVARVTNIVQTIETLKKQNIWVVGTDTSGEQSYFERDLTGPIALVIGSEGEGMGKLVRESCDFIVNIPMMGQISSLNAAVAGAIVTYEVLRQRSKKQL